MTATEKQEVARLREAWQQALGDYRAGTDGDDWATLFAAEQDAYDELVDYVEAHNLNGTAYDPRGAS